MAMHPNIYRRAVTLARGVRDDPPIRLRPGDRGYPESLEREFYLGLREDERAEFLAHKDALPSPSTAQPQVEKKLRRQSWMRRRAVLLGGV